MNNSIEIYHSEDGSVQLNVKLENETVWLTQIQMAELFNRDRTKKELSFYHQMPTKTTHYLKFIQISFPL